MKLDEKYDHNIDKREATMQRLHAEKMVTNIAKAVALSVATVFNVKFYIWNLGMFQR